jgi:hypothetical protein
MWFSLMPEMRGFFVWQGRTKVFAEAYGWYVAGGNLRRTKQNGKRTISGGYLGGATALLVLLPTTAWTGGVSADLLALPLDRCGLSTLIPMA